MLKKKNKGLKKGQNGFNINRRIFLFSFNFLLLASSLCIQIWHCYFFGFLTRLDDAMVVVDGDGVDDVEAEVGLKEGGMLKGCLCGGGGTRESKRGRGCCSLTASAPIRTSSIKR